MRIKKKLESDINELEIALDHANRANADAQRTIKKYIETVRELQLQVEDEQRQKEEVRYAAFSPKITEVQLSESSSCLRRDATLFCSRRRTSLLRYHFHETEVQNINEFDFSKPRPPSAPDATLRLMLSSFVSRTTT